LHFALPLSMICYIFCTYCNYTLNQRSAKIWKARLPWWSGNFAVFILLVVWHPHFYIKKSTFYYPSNVFMCFMHWGSHKKLEGTGFYQHLLGVTTTKSWVTSFQWKVSELKFVIYTCIQRKEQIKEMWHSFLMKEKIHTEKTLGQVLTLISLGIVNCPQIPQVGKTRIWLLLDDQMTSDLYDRGQHFQLIITKNNEYISCHFYSCCLVAAEQKKYYTTHSRVWQITIYDIKRYHYTLSPRTSAVSWLYFDPTSTVLQTYIIIKPAMLLP